MVKPLAELVRHCSVRINSDMGLSAGWNVLPCLVLWTGQQLAMLPVKILRLVCFLRLGIKFQAVPVLDAGVQDGSLLEADDR
jgi:hypothetical protein